MDIFFGIIDSIVRILGLIWWLILPLFVFFSLLESSDDLYPDSLY